jgi:hypothetical protein
LDSVTKKLKQRNYILIKEEIKIEKIWKGQKWWKVL